MDQVKIDFTRILKERYDYVTKIDAITFLCKEFGAKIPDAISAWKMAY